MKVLIKSSYILTPPFFCLPLIALPVTPFGILNLFYVIGVRSSIKIGFSISPFLFSLQGCLTLFCYYSGIMQDYYDRQVFKGAVDSTQLSFVGTIGFSFCGLMGPISQILTSAIGPRWVLCIGTILISLGLILASFSVEVKRNEP